MGNRVVADGNSGPADHPLRYVVVAATTKASAPFSRRRPPVEIALLFVLLLSSRQLCADDAIPLWQLKEGQTFIVQAATHRITEIQVGDVRTVSDIVDRVTLHYAMFRHEGDGAAHLNVTIGSLERTVRDENAEETTDILIPEQRLRKPRLSIVVRDQGRQVQTPDGGSIFRTDVPQSNRVLQQMCDDGVFESWFDLPFRVPVLTSRPPFRIPQEVDAADTAEAAEEAVVDESLLQAESAWNRTQHLALGQAGVVRCDCHYQIDSVEDQLARISFTGQTELVPRTSTPDSPILFQELQLSESEVTGTGTIRMDELSGFPQRIELSQQCRLTGRSTVQSGGQTHEMQFNQSLTQTWNASEFVMQDLRRGVPLQSIR